MNQKERIKKIFEDPRINLAPFAYVMYPTLGKVAAQSKLKNKVDMLGYRKLNEKEEAELARNLRGFAQGILAQLAPASDQVAPEVPAAESEAPAEAPKKSLRDAFRKKGGEQV